MLNRTTIGAAILASLALVATAGSTLAKEGAEAQLDAPLSLDTAPGTTIEVGWSVFTVEESGRHPMVGSPVFLRLVPPGGGDSVEVMGAERPSGSGHYVASISVPAGGIAEVVVGLRGEMCDANGCARSDILFPLTDDALVAGTPATAPGVPTQALIALVTGLLVVAGLGGVLVIRRTGLRSDPAAH